jgi:hypothetical protein
VGAWATSLATTLWPDALLRVPRLGSQDVDGGLHAGVQGINCGLLRLGSGEEIVELVLQDGEDRITSRRAPRRVTGGWPDH